MINRRVIWSRERKRLDVLAQEQGFDCVEQLYHELYEVQRVPYQEIARLLVLSPYTVRKRLVELGIKIRRPGGHLNNLHTEITEEIVLEVTRDGVPAVAERIGAEANLLAARIQEWLKKQEEKDRP